MDKAETKNSDQYRFQRKSITEIKHNVFIVKYFFKIIIK